MHDFPLITTIAVAFAAAWALGLIAQLLRLSPIVGYLVAGVLIGPHTPGVEGDLHLAQQLAEFGVILLMFGVGLHFHAKELLAVKSVAIPGALGQSLAATLAGLALFTALGMDAKSSVVLGMAVAVASTVVLMRVLSDADVLSTSAGHVAVGWLLVEDVLTVVALVLLPVLGGAAPEEPGPLANPWIAVGWALLKLATLIAIVIFAGSRVVPWALGKVARLRSRELFTLTVMVFSVTVAAGAYAAFGASMALGAFLAGMVVGQSPVSHQAAADALPLRDAFAVLFFVSVGMLFDPSFLFDEPWLFLGAMGIILLVKPTVALVIVGTLGYSIRTALTVAIGLAQIGEFSFILSEAAKKAGLLGDEGTTLLVGAAIISIAINPFLFRTIDPFEKWLRTRPRLWALLNARAERRMREENAESAASIAENRAKAEKIAVVVGYGPVGQTADKFLREAGLTTVVIDMNLDTIAGIRQQHRLAIYGDASRQTILESAGIQDASHLLLTLPHATSREGIIRAARDLNPRVKVFVRARYLRERESLLELGATAAVFEEAEAAVALARLVLVDRGAGRELIEHALRDVRMRLILDNVASLRARIVRDVMVPWTRVRRLTNSQSLEEVRRQVAERRYSRWPVVAEETGQPLGYLLAKDLIGFEPGASHWTGLLRPLAPISPEDDVESALVRFQQTDGTMFVVAEGRLPIGIVTIEDILELVVGRLEDEYPRHPKVRLSDVLVIDETSLNLSAATPEEAISELADRIPRDRLPPDVDVAKLAIERERELPTDIGGGVAIPHAPCPDLAQPTIVVGRSREGIPFHAEPGERVQLIFLLITPAERPDVHLHLLSQIARVAGDDDARRRFHQADSVEAFVAVLSEAWGDSKTPIEESVKD